VHVAELVVEAHQGGDLRRAASKLASALLRTLVADARVVSTPWMHLCSLRSPLLTVRRAPESIDFAQHAQVLGAGHRLHLLLRNNSGHLHAAWMLTQHWPLALLLLVLVRLGFQMFSVHAAIFIVCAGFGREDASQSHAPFGRLRLESAAMLETGLGALVDHIGPTVLAILVSVDARASCVLCTESSSTATGVVALAGTARFQAAVFLAIDSIRNGVNWNVNSFLTAPVGALARLVQAAIVDLRVHPHVGQNRPLALGKAAGKLRAEALFAQVL
jgi:hypothetical protein